MILEVLHVLAAIIHATHAPTMHQIYAQHVLLLDILEILNYLTVPAQQVILILM